MKRLIPALVVFLGISRSGFADGGDNTLDYYIGRSHVIIACRVKSEVFASGGEDGVSRYAFEVDGVELLHGTLPKTAKTWASLRRYEDDGERTLPFLQKGQKCILFLKRAPQGNFPELVGADMWFACQPHSRTMAQSIKRLSAERSAPPKDRR